MKPETVAQDAFASVAALARAHIAVETDPSATVIMVVGAQLSPSTRTVDGAEAIYQANDPDAWEAFEETFDALAREADFDGWTLSWEDGCLWLEGPDYDPDASIGTLGTWRNDA